MIDPYRDWLGLTDGRRPPTLYQLLGIATTESDPKLIEAAAALQLAKVQNHLTGSNSKLAWQIVDEIALAKTTLLDPVKRSAYDMVFGTGPRPTTPPAGPADWAPQPAAPPAAIPTTRVLQAPAIVAPLPAVHEQPPHLAPQPIAATPLPFNPLEHDEHHSDDSLPSAMALRKPRSSHGNSNLLILGGGIVALGLIGGAFILASRVGNKPAADVPEKKTEVVENSPTAPPKQPQHPTKKDLPKDQQKEKEPNKKITPPSKKKEPIPKEEPPPKEEMAPEFKEAKVFTGHEKTVRALAVSADGRKFLSIGDDKAVFSWSPASDTPVRSFTTESEGVGAAFLPGGREAIVADGSQSYLIDLAANNKKKDFKTSAGGVVAIAVSADGQHFLSVLQIGQLLYWDIGKDVPEMHNRIGNQCSDQLSRHDERRQDRTCGQWHRRHGQCLERIDRQAHQEMEGAQSGRDRCRVFAGRQAGCHRRLRPSRQSLGPAHRQRTADAQRPHRRADRSRFQR